MIIFPVMGFLAGGAQRETIDKEGNEEVMGRRRMRERRRAEVGKEDGALEREGISLPLGPLSPKKLNSFVFFSLQTKVNKKV